MDLIMQSLVERFQQDHDLTQLKEDEAFEAFAGFCVLSSFYESGFRPDAFRMGGGNDVGIDVFGILVNGELLRDSADVRVAAEQAKRLDVQVVIIQAKTSPGFDTKVISDLADNLMHIVSPGPVPYPASPDVGNVRDCLTAVYADLAKFYGRLPRLHVRYVTTAGAVADMVERKAHQAEKRLSSLGRFEAVSFRCVTQHELRALYKQATEAVEANFEMVKKISLPRIPGVQQALLGLLPAHELCSACSPMMVAASASRSSMRTCETSRATRRQREDPRYLERRGTQAAVRCPEQRHHHRDEGPDGRRR